MSNTWNWCKSIVHSYLNTNIEGAETLYIFIYFIYIFSVQFDTHLSKSVKLALKSMPKK